MSERRFTIIANPQSGGGHGLERGRQLHGELTRSGVDATLISTSSIGHAAELAAAAAGERRVAVGCGGDGLLRAVAAGLHRARVSGATGGATPTMAIAPAGRGNDFARTLGLPAEPGAVAELLRSDPGGRTIDLIDVGGEIALGNVYVGFDSASNELANRVNLGSFTYTYAGARVALGLKPLQFTVTVDDAPAHRFSGQGVTIASSAYYGGGTQVAPGADPRDGVLDVICFAQATRRHRAAALVALLRGRHTERDDVTRFAAHRQVQLELEPGMTAYADGDPIAATPFTATVLPAAIELLGA